MMIEPYIHPDEHAWARGLDPRPCLYDALMAIGEVPTEERLRQLTYMLADIGPHMVDRSGVVKSIKPVTIPGRNMSFEISPH
eukprot:1493268-Karenia_brevis.AAC.1